MQSLHLCRRPQENERPTSFIFLESVLHTKAPQLVSMFKSWEMSAILKSTPFDGTSPELTPELACHLPLATQRNGDSLGLKLIRLKLTAWKGKSFFLCLDSHQTQLPQH